MSVDSNRRPHLLRASRRITPILAVWCFGAGAASAAPPDDTVRVRVYAEHAIGRVVYHYQIENRGRSDLRQIILGCDCRPADHVAAPLLNIVPVGAQYRDSDYTDTEPELPHDLVRAPPGWRVLAHRPPGADKYWLEWHALGARGLGAGQTAKGFSVAVPRADRAFLVGRYTAPERGVVGWLELLDATPPRLTLKLEDTTPAASGETARVRVLATADDDFDPAPRLTMESFVPDETAAADPIRWSRGGALARPLRYTVTYTATDASGNTARSSLKVTIPSGGGGSVMLPTALHTYALIP